MEQVRSRHPQARDVYLNDSTGRLSEAAPVQTVLSLPFLLDGARSRTMAITSTGPAASAGK